MCYVRLLYCEVKGSWWVLCYVEYVMLSLQLLGELDSSDRVVLWLIVFLQSCSEQLCIISLIACRETAQWVWSARLPGGHTFLLV